MINPEVLNTAVRFESAALVLSIGVSVYLVLKSFKSSSLKSLSNDLKNESRTIQAKMVQEVIKANGVPISFIENSPVPQWFKYADLRMAYINSAYSATFGVISSEYVGKTDHDIWPKDVADVMVEHDRMVMQQRVRIEAYEDIPDDINNPSSAIRRWYVIKFPVVDQISGQIRGVGGMCLPQKIDIHPDGLAGDRIIKVIKDGPSATLIPEETSNE